MKLPLPKQVNTQVAEQISRTAASNAKLYDGRNMYKENKAPTNEEMTILIVFGRSFINADVTSNIKKFTKALSIIRIST